jgi:hypothetical protein
MASSVHQFFVTLAIFTQHVQGTPADAAAALQIFEGGFIRGYLTLVDVRALNVNLPGARELMAQGLFGTSAQLESAARAEVLLTNVAAAALGSQVAKLAQRQGGAQCGFWAGSTPSVPPVPPDKEAPREQKKGRSATTKSKMQAATGTVYYHSDGNHGGMVLLKTDSGLLDLTWSDESQLKPSERSQNLKLPAPIPVRARDNGAVWHVQYYKKDNGYGHFFLYLDKVTFTGEVNAAIDAASTLIKKYYELLARRKYTEAYGLFSERHKAYTTLEALGQTSSETFTSPADDNFCSTPPCIDIKIVSHDKTKVLIRVDAGLLKKPDYACYKNPDTCYSQHTIINMGGSWYIDDTQNIRDF